MLKARLFRRCILFYAVKIVKCFDVLLTVHLSVTLVNDQLDAQFFYFIINLLQSSTCFEQRRAHHQEVKVYSYSIWYTFFLYARFCASSLYITKIQQDATDAGIYLLQNYSTCFGCLSHPSSEVRYTVTAASGTGHITYQRGLIRPPWQKVVVLIRDMTYTRSCSYSFM